MSEEHRIYLKKIKKQNIIMNITRITILTILLFLWQYLADKGFINTFISSSPKAIINTIINLIKDGSLFYHIFITSYEIIISFLLGMTLGILIASIFWRYKTIYKIFEPYLTVLNSMPKVSLGPIIIILAGAGTKSIIIMALLISLIITIIDIHHAFKKTDINKIKLMKSFNANNSQIFFKLIIPNNKSNIINTCKMNIGLTFIGVIMGEFLVSKSGVGYLIMYGSQIFNLNLVMTGIILICLMSTIIYYIIIIIEKNFFHNNY